MAENFRVQFTRGTTAQSDDYMGREGELTIDMDKKSLRIHDGVTTGGHEVSGASDAGGGGGESVQIIVNDFTSGDFVSPDGVSVTKEYNDSSLKITHNKGKNPIGWSGINNSSNPAVAVLATSTVNMQVVDSNTIVLTNVSNYESAEYNLLF